MGWQPWVPHDAYPVMSATKQDRWISIQKQMDGFPFKTRKQMNCHD
jgi:hypothetical protein